MDQAESPNVVALQQEPIGQQPRDVSATKTSIPTGNSALPSVDDKAADEAPLVDIALASVRERTDVALSVAPEEELAAIRAEVYRLSENVAEIGSASVRVLRATSENVLEDARARIKTRPLRAVAWAMLAGFLFGAVR